MEISMKDKSKPLIERFLEQKGWKKPLYKKHLDGSISVEGKNLDKFFEQEFGVDPEYIKELDKESGV
jgi:hypothetical protein